MVGTDVDRLDTVDRPIELAVAARRYHVEDDGVLHAIQRRDPASGPARIAGRQRPVRPEAPALVDWRIRAQPHESGLHHRHERRTSHCNWGPARCSAPGWCSTEDSAVIQAWFAAWSTRSG